MDILVSFDFKRLLSAIDVRFCSGAPARLRSGFEDLVDRTAVNAHPVRLAVIEPLLRKQHDTLLMLRDRRRDLAIEKSLQARDEEKDLPSEGRSRGLERRRNIH
jgi:hypothetical protein